MAIRPQGVTISIGASSLFLDSIAASTEIRFYERSELNNDVLRSAPLSTGRVPQFDQSLDGTPAEIQILCDSATATTPRPLGPNPYPPAYKKRIEITRYRVVGGQTPETAGDAGLIDGLFDLCVIDKKKIARFDSRMNSTAGSSYDDLLALQLVDPATITVGSLTLSGGGYSDSDLLLTEFNTTGEFATPDGITLKGFEATLEKWEHMGAFD